MFYMIMAGVILVLSLIAFAISAWALWMARGDLKRADQLRYEAETIFDLERIIRQEST